MIVKSLKAAVKNIVGSCNSLGILVEGKKAIEINKDIESGIYDKKIYTKNTKINKKKN